MKTNIFYILPLFLVFMACEKDDNLTPSNIGKDWFIIKDDPNDSVNHAIYLFYKEMGIPIFYNDTIGIETRVDNWGNTFTHYEVLSSNYSLGGFGSTPYITDYELCPKEHVLDGINFLKVHIMPTIPESIKIRSILFLESLYTFTERKYAYKGLNTVMISDIPKINEMDDEEFSVYRTTVLSTLIIGYLMNYNYELDNFYRITRSYYADADLYGYAVWYFTNNTTYKDPKEVGFLGVNPSSPGSLPTESIDVNMYLEEIFSGTKEKFTEQYGDYEPIMRKYEIMVSILRDLGFSI